MEDTSIFREFSLNANPATLRMLARHSDLAYSNTFTNNCSPVTSPYPSPSTVKEESDRIAKLNTRFPKGLNTSAVLSTVELTTFVR